MKITFDYYLTCIIWFIKRNQKSSFFFQNLVKKYSDSESNPDLLASTAKCLPTNIFYATLIDTIHSDNLLEMLFSYNNCRSSFHDCKCKFSFKNNIIWNRISWNDMPIRLFFVLLNKSYIYIFFLLHTPTKVHILIYRNLTSQIETRWRKIHGTKFSKIQWETFGKDCVLFLVELWKVW